MIPYLCSVLSTWLHAEVKRQGAQDRDKSFGLLFHALPLHPPPSLRALCPQHPLGLSFIDGNQDFRSETAGFGLCMATRKCPRLRQGALAAYESSETLIFVIDSADSDSSSSSGSSDQG